VTRDLFTGDFVKAYVDNDQAFKRITGYLKKTSPHMVERVVRYKETASLMEAFGIEQEIKSTLSRRVDLPSGGYLIFDYAEAFTVIDVNTGRFVGSRGKSSGARLEDTITKNNLEAVKEVVRQLRLRDIGGIIVIDFIDMANPKNRSTVEEALRTELERDRTKTYVVEISPLGLVEMTRQNVTDGPREIMTRKCPTCGGDGIVYSEASAAIDVERRVRALVAGSRSQAYRVELAAPIAAALIGPGASRLRELEAMTKRRFFLEGKPDTHLDHFVVLAEGKLADLAPKAPFEEGAELQVELGEVDRHDGTAGVGKLDGFDVCVAEAASLVGKRVKVRIERVLDGVAYATLVRRAGKQAPEPLTAEAEAEKPTRKPPARKTADATPGEDGDDLEEEEAAESDDVAEPVVAEAEPASLDEPEVDDEEAPAETVAGAPAKKKTRRGSRGGKKRKKPAGAPEAGGTDEIAAEADAAPPEESPGAKRPVTIHVPSDELGREDEDTDVPEAEAEQQPSENGAAPAKKKTRRGSRGGKNRRKRVAAATAANGADTNGEAGPADEPEEAVEASTPHEEPVAVVPEPAPDTAKDAESDEDWGYVPMSEWGDELK
jgi:ribonuclease G